MQKNILLALAAIILIGGGIYYVTKKPCDGASCALGKPVTVLEDSTSGTEAVATQENDPTTQTTSPSQPSGSATLSPTVSNEPTLPVADGQPIVLQKGTYEAYSPDKIARAETGDVVLFFHASWCPSCRALSTDIEGSRSDIPAGLTILKLDYDKETALKKKYGVTYQHTLVQVDADGNLIKKWSGGGTLETIVAQVK